MLHDVDGFILLLFAATLGVKGWIQADGWLTQELKGNGFHRTINYFVSREGVGRNCSLMIKQHVAAHMYIDMDEVQSIEAFGGPKVSAKQHFDTEKPAYKAESQIVTIYPKKYVPKSKVLLLHIGLPVHIRYQKPVLQGNLATIGLESGSLYSNCRGYAPKADTLKDQCDDSSTLICKWELVGKFKQPNGYAQIPTGNLDSAIVVTVTTLVVTALSSALVVLHSL